jgi:hypothetical protein
MATVIGTLNRPSVENAPVPPIENRQHPKKDTGGC